MAGAFTAPAVAIRHAAPPTKPVVLDTSVVKSIGRGNSHAAAALKQMRASGVRVYISRLAYRELVIDAPTSDLGKRWRLLLRDAKIKIPPKSPMGDRVDVYRDNIAGQEFPHEMEYKPRGGLTQYKSKGLKENLARPGDVFVAAEAKSVGARLWTFDKNLAKRGAKLGIDIAPESNLPIPENPNDDPGTARRLLGVKEPALRRLAARIDLKTKAIRLIGGVRGVGRTIGGSGIVGAGVSFAVAIGMVFLQKLMMKGMMEDELRKGLKAAEAKIEERLNALKPEIAKQQLMLEKDQKVFANITIQVHYVPKKGARASYTDVEVRLTDVNITLRDINTERTYEKTYEKEAPLINQRIKHTIDERTYSFEVGVFTPEELSDFQELYIEYLDLKRRVIEDPSDDLLKRERKILAGELFYAFGPDLWFLDEEDRRVLMRYQ